ncbi:hypothetical protein OIE66_00200 [Nonomuraea sp. NBC_01738]|uniref:hypothetical protein n=1 Tax=Nonomuraea sp. NBC_01738 TaxID=2976003 RepID=UPI002E1523D6|nr:hypothetical protein OIE66_00200 [Nonomuraea sp. NBC_01738]
MRLGFSPMIPTIASFLLAALWGLSVFAGWGIAAFCGPGSPQCEQRLEAVAGVSGLFAVLAAVCTAAAWVIPAARRDQRVFTLYMGSACAAWIVAEGVLFLGGLLVG